MALTMTCCNSRARSTGEQPQASRALPIRSTHENPLPLSQCLEGEVPGCKKFSSCWGITFGSVDNSLGACMDRPKGQKSLGFC